MNSKNLEVLKEVKLPSFGQIFSLNDDIIKIDSDSEDIFYSIKEKKLLEYYTNYSMDLWLTDEMLNEIKKYKKGGSGTNIGEIKYLPNRRYIVISGSDHVSACPSVPSICTLGFIAIFDNEKKHIIYWEEGGEREDNGMIFAISPDGKYLKYIIDTEPLEKLKNISLNSILS